MALENRLTRAVQATRSRLGAMPTVQAARARLETHIDEKTGFSYQYAYGHKIFLKSWLDYIPPGKLEWLCRDIYFAGYRPSGADVIVDVGAGYGHEAFYLTNDSPRLRYFGIEVQPSVYECLCNTFRPTGGQCKAIGTAITKDPTTVRISSLRSYEKASTEEEGYIEVPSMRWRDFIESHGLTKIDLLKVNIEGGERHLLPAIGDMNMVQRCIISAHDFRADIGEGEHFRTREFVTAYLQQQRFAVRSLAEEGFMRDWLYCERAE